MIEQQLDPASSPDTAPLRRQRATGLRLALLLEYPREYAAWRRMYYRCKKTPTSMSVRWKQFELFLNDMGVCPEGAVLDRERKSYGYEKSNCRWISKAISNRGINT